MPAISILIFFGAFIFIVLVTLFIFVTFYNRKTRVAIDKFIFQANELKPILFENIKLRYWSTSGQRTQVSPNNHCELYLFDNCLAMVRRQNFVFKVFFAPVIITSDIAKAKGIFNYLDIYKPKRVHFNQILKGEIDINITDPIHQHRRVDITFKELSGEQLTQLEKIKTYAI